MLFRSASLVYQLPAFASGGLGKLTNDWQISAIVRGQSGDHFNVTTGTDSALTGQTNQRPNRVASADPYKKQGNVWLNPAAFSAPAPGTYGNVPINAFIGPGAFNVDMGVTRSFRLRGQQAFQFRAELFNVLNTVQKGDPVATLNSPNFGVITTAADPRIMQFAIKYTF